MRMGSDTGSNGASGSGESSGGSGPTAEAQFRQAVDTEFDGLDTETTPEELYSAAVTIEASRSVNSIEVVRAIEIIDGETEPGEIRDLVVAVIEMGYTLQDVQSAMTGVFSDETSGIKAALSLDENIDGDGNAQMSGAVEWVDGIEGAAARFDAEGEYVTLPDDPSIDMLSEEAAVEVWVYPENNTAAAGIIHKGTQPDFSDESYSLQYNRAGEVAMIFTNETGDHTYVIAPTPRLTENNWHHIVVEWDQTTVRLYIDGAEITALNYYQSGWKSSLPSNFAPIRDSDGDLMIGAQPVGEYFFAGIIDNVTLYDRKLGPSEVNSNWQALAP
jgi:hypothetical protein